MGTGLAATGPRLDWCSGLPATGTSNAWLLQAPGWPGGTGLAATDSRLA